MQDKHDIEAVQRQREHNEQMRRAGEEFSRMVDRGADEQREAVGELVLEALAKKYGLNDGDDDTTKGDAA